MSIPIFRDNDWKRNMTIWQYFNLDFSSIGLFMPCRPKIIANIEYFTNKVGVAEYQNFITNKNSYFQNIGIN